MKREGSEEGEARYPAQQAACASEPRKPPIEWHADGADDIVSLYTIFI
jgi:hypothetical protein